MNGHLFQYFFFLFFKMDVFFCSLFSPQVVCFFKKISYFLKLHSLTNLHKNTSRFVSLTNLLLFFSLSLCDKPLVFESHGLSVSIKFFLFCNYKLISQSQNRYWLNSVSRETYDNTRSENLTLSSLFSIYLLLELMSWILQYYTVLKNVNLFTIHIIIPVNWCSSWLETFLSLDKWDVIRLCCFFSFSCW